MLRTIRHLGISIVCLAMTAGAFYLFFEPAQRLLPRRSNRQLLTGSLPPDRLPGLDVSPSANADPQSDAALDADSLSPPVLAGVSDGVSISDTGVPPLTERVTRDARAADGHTSDLLSQLDSRLGTNGHIGSSDWPSDSYKPLPTERLQRLLQLSTVRVSHPELGPLGGGVVISRSRTGFEVLTAQHVIDGLDIIKITTFHPSDRPNREWTERNYIVRGVVKSDSLPDLALLRVNSALQPEVQLEVASESDDLAEAAWALVGSIGTTPSSELVELGGRQRARRQLDSTPVSYWRVMRPSEHGTSGSGLVDVYGRLIGIASGNSDGIAFYTDDIEIRKFLEGR